MKINRRNVLLAAAAIATAPSRSAQAPERRKRVSQQELDEAIRLHGAWLADVNCGQRCMFGGRNLSGLQFGVLGGDPIDLNGADFAQADLSETEAGVILIDHCNFNAAKFDGCRWRQPVFAFADMRRASLKNVELGNPACFDPEESLRADFQHVVFNDADLSGARIRGHFHGTKFVGALLVRADLSLSDFFGERYCKTSFTTAKLSGAKLLDCRMSSVSFFNADCSAVDFSRTVLSDVQMKGCNLNCARFHDAEIERTPFSAEQRDKADLGRIVT